MASTVPRNMEAIRAARPNDIAASGPPSEIARMDLNIARLLSADPAYRNDCRSRRHAPQVRVAMKIPVDAATK